MAEAGLELMLVPMPHSLFLRSGVAGKRAAGVGEQALVTPSSPSTHGSSDVTRSRTLPEQLPSGLYS